MWEVDPETKSKVPLPSPSPDPTQPIQTQLTPSPPSQLAALQKRPGNGQCVDCTAPSPQWASPKFGTFICLTCAGLHRGLGVHISFVRSIQMDSFKATEIKRMDLGGNEAWKAFWTGRTGGDWGRPGEGGDAAAVRGVEERYGGGVGEEYKERLGCVVDGREFGGVPVQERKVVAGRGIDSATASAAAPVGGMGAKGRKELNEDFFARKGSENFGRPEGLAPSQGGKYAGFGSEPIPASGAGGGGGGGGALPGVEELQADPVGALTKGFWGFAGAVGKGARTLNEGYIQPTAQKLAEADLATQARLTAAQAAKTIQTSTKGAAEKFNNFVENAGEGGNGSAGGKSRNAVQPEKKDFWDSFGEAGADRSSSAIGTSAMRKGGAGGGGKEEGWGDW